jgi:methylenetetrahydrofolate dehydrogenase (NADP+)/methenyltetrahydrofolate cyclohydrolase
MTAKRIDGKAAAQAIRERVAALVPAFERRAGRAPGLATVLVGEDPASAVYVRSKNRSTEEAGMAGFAHNLPATISEDELLQLVIDLNSDERVDGILVQLPLPGNLDGQMMIDAIRPEKDVDGFHPMNVGKLFTAQKIDPERMLIPCTPLGSLMMLLDTLGPGGLAGRTAVVVGRSNIVGKPMGQLLLAYDCTVTTAHSKSRDLPAICRTADILVAAVGRPEMVRGDWIKEGAVVIDVGINRVPTEDGKGRIVGDVATAEAMGRAAHVTPVPGGVGKMTVACLLHNTVVAAEARAELV